MKLAWLIDKSEGNTAKLIYKMERLSEQERRQDMDMTRAER